MSNNKVIDQNLAYQLQDMEDVIRLVVADGRARQRDTRSGVNLEIVLAQLEGLLSSQGGQAYRNKEEQ